MKPLDADRLRLVEDWIAKAELDFATVVRLLEESTFREIVAFHAQQSVEKYLKSLLTFYQIEFSKTHVIRRLLILLEPQVPELAQELSDANWLTPFGADIRYPGDQPGTLPGDEYRAHELALLVRERVLRHLGRWNPLGV